jgi:hypothetical protein
VALFGDQYRRYRQRVGMLIPWPHRDAAARSADPQVKRT